MRDNIVERMDDLPLVSVLMTAFNREKYIEEAIRSVLSSSYHNFELIIVDDCSTDGTVSIINKYSAADSRIRFYINEKNLGDYHNRNRAASYALGKYLKYVDSDDMIYPQSLTVFVSSMEMFPDAALGIMNNQSQDIHPYPFALTPKEAYEYNFFRRGIFDTGPSALIFRRDRFNEIGGFSGKRFVGDTEINLRLGARWPVVLIESALIYWREHEGQEIRAGNNSTGYLELLLPVLRNALGEKDCPLSDGEKKKILDYNRKVSARQILNIALMKRDPKNAFRIFKNLSLSGTDFYNAVFHINKKIS